MGRGAPGGKSGNTWTVDGNIDLGTIVSNAAAGDTITVKKGVYAVSNGILVGAGVTLRGEGLPLIKNYVDGTSGAGCLNLSDNVVIDGLEITNALSDTKFQYCIGAHHSINGNNTTNWIVKDVIGHGDSDCFLLKEGLAKTIWGNVYDSVFLSKWDAIVLLGANASASISCNFWNCTSIVYTESVKNPGMSGYTHACGYDGQGTGYIEIHGGYYASTNNSIGQVFSYQGPSTAACRTYVYGATIIGTNAATIVDVPSGSAGWQARFIGCNMDKGGPIHDLSGPLGALDGPADVQVISGGMDSFEYRETVMAGNGAATGSTVMGDAVASGGGDTTSGLAPTANEGAMRRQASDTTAGNDTGISGNLNYRTGKYLYFKSAVKQDVIITKRFFYGLTDQTITTMGGADNAAGNYAGFLLTTNISGNKILTVTKDNVTQTSTTTAVAQDTATTHIYEIIFDDAYPRVIFKMDGQVVATHTTHLPAASTNLRYVIGGKKFDATQRNTDIEYVRVRSLR
jgi:hypothetical protein